MQFFPNVMQNSIKDKSFHISFEELNVGCVMKLRPVIHCETFNILNTRDIVHHSEHIPRTRLSDIELSPCFALQFASRVSTTMPNPILG